VLAGVTAVACAGGGVDAQEPAEPLVPSEFAATFDVESPMGLVAGDGQAWVLRSDGSGAALSRIDHTGRLDEVLQLAGQGFAMAPYRDGVAVVRAACDAEDCTETAVTVLALDSGGSTVADAEFARRPGGIQDAGEVRLFGVQDDVVWLDTSDGLIGHDLSTGRTVAQTPSPLGVTCLLADGLYTLVPLDGQYAGHGGPIVAGAPDPQYDAELHRIVDGEWAPVPGSVQPLDDVQFQLARCQGGGVDTGSGLDAGLVWSPASGWVDREPYLAPLSLTVAPEPTTSGQGDQLFVLEAAGVMRRWSAGPDGPMSPETLDVPADIFVQPFGPVVHLLFDASSSVSVGCVQQSASLPAADCWIGSLDG
jgi:hypothetical protein